jgi:hypothetical protein
MSRPCAGSSVPARSGFLVMVTGTRQVSAANAF